MKKHCVLAILLLFNIVAWAQMPLPQIPPTAKWPSEQADYLAIHFYDAMDWNDPVMTSDENLLHDWANFLNILPLCSKNVSNRAAITKWIHTIPDDKVSTYSKMVDGYFFANDSELYHEKNYLTTLLAFCTHPGINDKDKSVLESRLKYLSRCAPGTVAPDITVELLRDGTTALLSELKNKAHNLLLVLYNHNCDDCNKTLHELSTGKDWIQAQDLERLLVVKAEITEETDSLYLIQNVPSLYHLDGFNLSIIARNIPLCDEILKEGVRVFSDEIGYASFPGGYNKLQKFINENLEYPQQAINNKIEGTVIVGVFVKMDGNIGETKVIQSQGELLDKEALRLISKMPNMVPKRVKGKPENSWMEVSIPFKLPQDK